MTRRTAVTPAALTAEPRQEAAPDRDTTGPIRATSRLKQSVCRWCYGGIKLDGLCTRAAEIGLKRIMPLAESLGPTVPSAVCAWVELSNRFGALPLETVAQPTIAYASEGFAASPLTADSWYRSARGHYA